MELESGPMPKWKGKPKHSPVDTDPNYIKLIGKIARSEIKPHQFERLVFSQEVENKRLGVKNAWRTVRDHLIRYIRRANLQNEYRVIARQREDGLWVVGVVFEPVEAEQTAKAATPRQRSKREYAV